MEAIKGKNLMLFVNVLGSWMAAGCARSCTLSLSREAIETMPTSDFEWRDYSMGKMSWALSSDYFLTLEMRTKDGDFFDLQELVKRSPDELRLLWSTTPKSLRGRPDGGFFPDLRHCWHGRGFVTSYSEVANVDDNVAVSISFQGVGPLKFGHPDFGDLCTHFWQASHLWHPGEVFVKSHDI